MTLPASCRRFAACLIVGLCASSAHAGTFSSDHGYSIDYPDGWTIADRAESAQLEDEVGKVLSPATSNSGFGLDVVILGPSGETFTPNVNVVVSPRSTTVTEGDVGAVRQAFIALHRDKGGELRQMAVTVETVGDRDAYSLRYATTMPGRDAPLWQWGLIVPNGGTTCHFTCSCLPEEKEQFIPVFEEMIGSVRFETPVTPASGKGWLPGVVVAIFVGCGAVGGVIAIRRRRAKTREHQQ
jgi:hypothetical protein